MPVTKRWNGIIRNKDGKQNELEDDTKRPEWRKQAEQ